jgi:hypothetical protein
MADPDRLEGIFQQRADPSEEWAVITPGAGVLARIPRFLMISDGAALPSAGEAPKVGTITVSDKEDNSVVFRVVSGQRLDIRPWKVTAVSTDMIVIACY